MGLLCLCCCAFTAYCRLCLHVNNLRSLFSPLCVCSCAHCFAICASPVRLLHLCLSACALLSCCLSVCSCASAAPVPMFPCSLCVHWISMLSPSADFFFIVETSAPNSDALESRGVTTDFSHRNRLPLPHSLPCCRFASSSFKTDQGKHGWQNGASFQAAER